MHAFKKVVNQIPKVKLLLIGDGDTKLEIEKLVASLDINPSTIFTGPIDNSLVPADLNAADICVAPYPQLKDGIWFSPMKILEYMATGKSVVASCSGQAVDLIEDGETGLLVSPGDVEHLSKVLIELINDPIMRAKLGEQARQKVVENYSWDQVARNLENLYAQVIGMDKMIPAAKVRL